MTLKQPIISQREEDILRLLYEYRYLSLPLLVQGLGYATASINHVGEIAKGATDKGLLFRFPLPSTSKGTRSYIYTLSRRGLSYLRSLGIDDTEGWSPTDIAPSYMHFSHSLATNEFMLAATRLPERNPNITIHKITPEWKLRKHPLRAPSGDGNTLLPMIADALIAMRFRVGNKLLQATIWVEVDRGSEGQKQLRRKIHALSAIAGSPAHLAIIEARVLTVAFATTEDEKRRADIQTWIEQELRIVGKTNEADMFLTTCMTPGSLDPISLFTEPIWFVPFTSEKVPLIDLSLS